MTLKPPSAEELEDSLDEISAAYFRDTTAMKKVFSLTKRIRAVSGGTAASKSISILTWIIDYSQSSRNKKCDVVSESYPHLEMGVMEDFKTIMKSQGYWDDQRWHDTKHIYTFETGTTVRFFSVDTYGKAHGPRRDILFVNECNNLPYNIVDQLITRTREVVWLDWNPSVEFWFYTEMLPHRDDIDFIGDGGVYGSTLPPLTYKDNEALLEEVGQLTIKEIESHKHNAMWWQVYGLGRLGNVEGKIYSGWRKMSKIPDGAKLLRYWVDFGYSHDPASIGAVYKYNDSFIVHQLCYQRGMSNEEIAAVLNAQPEKVLVICDSSEPKSIDDLISYGINAIGAIKGPDSVDYGIKTLQKQKIFITTSSLQTLKEYRAYQFKKDKNGKITTTPQDGFDHSMDGIRYAISSIIKPERKTTTVTATKKWSGPNRVATVRSVEQDINTVIGGGKATTVIRRSAMARRW